MADLIEAQRSSLVATIGWAERVRDALRPVRDRHAGRVHFRPGSDGFAMVGLLPDRPLQGKKGLRRPSTAVRDFDSIFRRYCSDVAPGWPTPAKELQAFLIRDAQAHGGHLHRLNRASESTLDPVDLVFVVDELALPAEGGSKVGGLLALRRDGGRNIPVLIELASERNKERLVEQLEGYAPVVELHRDLFSELFSVILDETVSLVGPVEKWILWPRSGPGPDRREAELAARGVRVVGYTGAPDTGGYRFNVGGTSVGGDARPAAVSSEDEQSTRPAPATSSS